MNLKFLLEDLFNGPAFDRKEWLTDYMLDCEVLKKCEFPLSNLDEFKDTAISFYDKNDGIPLSEFKTYMLFDGARFSGDVKLLSICTGGPMSKVDVEELPNSSIIKYASPLDFSPMQILMLKCTALTDDYSDEVLTMLKADRKERLHRMVDAMLDDPDKFLAPKNLPIMVRAVVNRDVCNFGCGEKMTVNIKRKLR